MRTVTREKAGGLPINVLILPTQVGGSLPGNNMKPDIDTAVLRDQIDLLYNRKYLATFSFPVLGMLVAYVLGEHSGAGNAVAWFLAVCAITIIGIVLGQLYKRRSASPDRTVFWARVGVASSALNGIVFGAAGLLLYPPHSVPHQAFLILFLGGICACALASSFSYLPAYLCFVVPTICPIIVRVALDFDEVHIVMSILTAIFAGFMVAFGKVGSRAVKEVCVLKHEKIALAEKLEAANKELEAFSYSVSHDLRTPLRAIGGFAGILREEYGAKLDDEGKRICSVIADRVRKMGQLIDAILSLSHLSRAELRTSSIDMKALASEVYHELADAGMRQRIDFRLGDLGKANADPVLIKQVWVNLISNAIKFSSHRERPVISVACREEAGRTIYCVKDNGAGFDEKHRDKLFGVFQRLHREKEYAGTGVGLAIVQRIVLRHGGEVRGTGETDKGAEFCFALRKKGG